MNRWITAKATNFISQEDGALLIEYVLLLALIVMIAFIAMKFYGGTVSNKMGNNSNSVANAMG